MQPFLKWAGGKRWLLPKLRETLPGTFGRYFEPFLGGGAVFFDLLPPRSLLSDKNPELIEAYQVLRDHPLPLQEKLSEHDQLHSDDYYYEVRSSASAEALERAARFLYLNRTCWNGLYRVNQRGEFNVPRGTKNKIILEGENFEAFARALSGADLRCSDFEDSIKLAGQGDLVYADPPYTVKHNMNGFLKYNQEIFSWEDQIRLCRAAEAARERGATVILSNADHASLWELYKDADDISRVSRASVISGKVSGRATTSEIVAFFRGEA
jgi:DNA adenine methylase